METINHECYVSLEVAKLLKEAGFDWHTNLVYVDDKLLTNPYTEDWNNTIPDTYTSVPTLEVAQRWLREVKKLYIEVQVFSDSNINGVRFGANIENSSIATPELYNTYEEALEAGIKKALEIMLKKGE